jgi:hypothetical protein
MPPPRLSRAKRGQDRTQRSTSVQKRLQGKVGCHFKKPDILIPKKLCQSELHVHAPCQICDAVGTRSPPLFLLSCALPVIVPESQIRTFNYSGIVLYFYVQIDSHASRGYLSMLNFGASSRVTHAVVECSQRFVTQKIAQTRQKSSNLLRKVLNLSKFLPMSRPNFELSNCRIGKRSHASPPVSI